MGKDICYLWGLIEWGSGCRDRDPQADLKAVQERLPIIKAYRGGKGIFDYGSILPSYIPTMLQNYGAAMSTSNIKWLVINRITPPIMQLIDCSGLPEDWIQDGMASDLCKMPSPEDLMAEEESRNTFFQRLSERELKVLQFKEDGLSIDEIAEKLVCSKKTVNNDWKSIFEKFKQLLGI
jgi:hypothetical protein